MKYIVIAITAVVLASCGAAQKSDIEYSKSFSELAQKFDEEWPKANNIADLKSLSDSINIEVDAFILNHPTSENLGNSLLKAGEINRIAKNGEKAIEYFNKLEELFPNHAETPKAIFFKAQTYEDLIGDEEKAIETYRIVVKKYYKSDWADWSREAVDFIQDKSSVMKKINSVINSVDSTDIQ